MHIDTKVDAIKSYIKELYPDCIHDYETQNLNRFYCFYIRQTLTEQYILKLTDLCIENRHTEEITKIIESDLKQVLESNINKIILLKRDFTYTVSDIDRKNGQ